MNTTNMVVKAPDYFRIVEHEALEKYDVNSQRFPIPIIWCILAVCIMPSVLNLMGVDFGSHAKPFDAVAAASMAENQLLDAMFYKLTGAFTHSLLEWSAFCAAIFTAFLAFTHYRTTGDVTTPIIGIALICAGCMDAFHTLAATRLIHAAADNQNLIPFTWAICRVFNAGIMIIGVSIFIFRKVPKDKSLPLRGDIKLLGIATFCFGMLAYGIIQYCATSINLPQTIYPDSLITRPWDVAPLLLFLFAGLVLYPRFYRLHPSLFAHGLLISAVPEVVLELHMAFGSTGLFDNHFNIAHFLKVVAYLIPFIGLALDFIQTYKKQEYAMTELNVSQVALAERATELVEANTRLNEEMKQRMEAQQKLTQYAERLEISNRELKDFAHIASHDMQEPLRKIQTFGNRLHTKYKDSLPVQARDYVSRMQNAAERMQTLLSDLLTFSSVTHKANPFAWTDLNVLVKAVLTDLEIRIEETDAKIDIGRLPVLEIDQSQIRQLFQNLIANSLKFCRPGVAPEIKIHGHIIVNEDDSVDPHCELTVRDNGIGFEQHHCEQIFTVFQRLHGRSEYQGNGIGLAICRRIIEHHGGTIFARSIAGQGTSFIINLPITQGQND